MLTKKQVWELEYNFKSYIKSKQRIISTLKSWWHNIVDYTEENEVFLDKFIKKQKKEYFLAVKSWEKQTRYTPTEKASIEFTQPTELKLNKIYHISWAYRAAKFRLKSFDNEYAYLDNPKHKRPELLKISISDLRECR